MRLEGATYEEIARAGGGIVSTVKATRAADEATLNQAISFFQRALALDPKYYLAYNAMGLAYSLKGDLPSAVSAFLKCLEINPSFTEARNNLGSIYEAQGFVDKAEAEYLKAVRDETYPSRQLPLYNLARLSFLKNKNEDALDYVNRALRFDPRLAMAHHLKGMILEKLEHYEDALSSYETASRLLPEDLNLQLNLGLMCLKTERRERAKDIFNRILQKTDDPDLRKKALEALDTLKNPPPA